VRSWDILSMHRCESTKVFITHALSDLVYFGNERGHRVFHKEQATGLGSARWQRLYMRVRIVTEIGSPLLHHHRPAITAPYCHPFAHSPIRPFAHSALSSRILQAAQMSSFSISFYASHQPTVKAPGKPSSP